MEELELFPRPAAFSIHLKLEEPHGWTLRICRLTPERPARYDDVQRYEALSLGEAFDVMTGIISEY